MLLGAHAQEVAFGGDDVGPRDACCVKAVPAPGPSEAAAHRVADDADAGARAGQAREAVGRSRRDHVLPQSPCLDPGRPGFGSYPHAPLMREVLMRTPPSQGAPTP